MTLKKLPKNHALCHEKSARGLTRDGVSGLLLTLGNDGKLRATLVGTQSIAYSAVMQGVQAIPWLKAMADLALNGPRTEISTEITENPLPGELPPLEAEGQEIPFRSDSDPGDEAPEHTVADMPADAED